MWAEEKRSRFRDLQKRQQLGSLSEFERTELNCLTAELEVAEAAYLAPATQRLRQEREVLDSQNRTLEALARRKEALAVRLRAFLVDAEAERRAIENEVANVLAGAGIGRK